MRSAASSVANSITRMTTQTRTRRADIIGKRVRTISLPILSLSLMTLLAIPLPATHASHDLVGQFLRDTMGFSGGDVAAVQAGRPIARQMKTRDPVDVNIFGAVRIEAPAETLVRQLHNIDILEHRLGIRQVGKFHDPPQPSDLDGVTLESSDLDALADCRPADCEVQ